MLKKIFILCLLLGHTLSVQALDKTRVNLDKEFWGTWVLHNPKTQCIEKFEFKKPGDFKYQVNKKLLVGEFAVVRSTSSDNLDVLLMNVTTDNLLEGCAGDKSDYNNTKIQLALKWITPKMAEICTNVDAKACTGLYLTKSK